jgi:hypothetical protein
MIFVASSSEQLETARAIGRGLESADWEVLVWHTQFAFSAAYIESLERALDRADFAVVVMTGDDAANVRQGAVVLPRDNVVFELGLFIGRLGRERCAFFHDASASTRIASDLEGVKGADFYPEGLADDRARPALSVRIRQVKQQIRTVLTQSGPRYKPDAQVRALQQRRWHFLRRIEGPWWERMRTGDDDASALSQVTIRADPTTNGARLVGKAFGLDHRLLATWEAAAELLLEGAPTLAYRWTGQHERRHAAAMGGSGTIVFDSELDPQRAEGFFYDTRLSEIEDGLAPTREKSFRLTRLDAQDLADLADPSSAAARACVARQSQALRWDG